jgi:hypothetical protein
MTLVSDMATVNSPAEPSPRDHRHYEPTRQEVINKHGARWDIIQKNLYLWYAYSKSSSGEFVHAEDLAELDEKLTKHESSSNPRR